MRIWATIYTNLILLETSGGADKPDLQFVLHNKTQFAFQINVKMEKNQRSLRIRFSSSYFSGRSYAKNTCWCLKRQKQTYVRAFKRYLSMVAKVMGFEKHGIGQL